MKELFYLSPDGTIMAVDVKAGAVFQAGTPKPSFKAAPGVICVGCDCWTVHASWYSYLWSKAPRLLLA